MEDPPSPYDSDVDSGSRMIANLNASISGPPTAEANAAAVAAAAASEEPQNRSFSVSGTARPPVLPAFLTPFSWMVLLHYNINNTSPALSSSFVNSLCIVIYFLTKLVCPSPAPPDPVGVGVNYLHETHLHETNPLSTNARAMHLFIFLFRLPQITTSQLHPLNDSDSSLELTGNFSNSNTDELKAVPAAVSAVGPRGNAASPGSSSGSNADPDPQSEPVSPAVSVARGGGSEAAGDDSR